VLLSSGREATSRNHLKSATVSSFSAVDELVLNLELGNMQSLQELAKGISSHFSDEQSKVRGIFTWVAMNIAYDRESFITSGTLKDQSSKAVWSSRLAVCEGYANLLNEMCAAIGIESRLVKGYVRELMRDELNYPNHAWNSVKIDGKWHLMDVTWASINIEKWKATSQNRSTAPNYQVLDYYFLPNPETFIYTHLPEDPYWQLQSNYIDLQTFIAGETEIDIKLLNDTGNELSFEDLIEAYEQLDSLDRSIAYLERMTTTSDNTVRAYGLGIGYYYKAQQILEQADRNNRASMIRAKANAKVFYQKSLDQLSLLRHDDYGYELSQDLAKNVSFRIEVLQ
jgi:hypothetical protein